MGKITKAKLIRTIHELKRTLPNEIEFIVKSIRYSKLYNSYWGEFETQYKSKNMVLKPLTKFRYEFEQVNTFFEELFKFLCLKVYEQKGIDITLVEELKDRGLTLELTNPVIVKTNKNVIIKYLELLEKSLQ